MEKIVVLKFTSGEEVVATFVEENDYEISVMFPMLVKYMPRQMEGRIVEAITLAPYSHFSGDDMYTFGKHHLVFTNEMNPNYHKVYALAVEDFIAASNPPSDIESIDQLKDTVNKLKEIFGKDFDQPDYDEFYDDPPSKSIH